MTRPTRLPYMISLAAALIAALPCLAAETFEEIESFPTGFLGAWIVGGQTFIADEHTRFDRAHPPRVGHLCELRFEIVGGRAVAKSIDPRTYGPDHPSLDDGPFVFWRDPDTVELIAWCRGEIHRSVHENVAGAFDATSPCGFGPTVRVDPAPPTPPRASWPAPSRLLAVSDLEGNADTLLEFLRGNGVIDDQGRWSYGDAHLVFNGDIVDRGSQVTEILWFIRRLEREAVAANGRVHFVLGNHEVMIMAGDLRYIHPKYRFTTGRLGVPYDALYGPTSEMGRWLRSRNAMVRIGHLLFVHAGYSPALDRVQLGIDAINETIRSRLGPPAWPTDGDFATRLAWDRQGPLWYRGYFEQDATKWGKRPSDAEIAAIAARNQVEHIVVGHTLVDDVRWLDEGRRLIGIDVHWRDPAEAEGLLVEDGAVWRVNSSGARQPLQPPHGASDATGDDPS